MEKYLDQNAQADSKIIVEGPVRSEKFEINPNHLIYARSAGNYLDLYIEVGAGVRKLTKRLSLSTFATYFHEQKQILRIHNSYIANLDKIKQVSGNAAGLTLKFKSIAEIIIPVSSKYIKKVEGILQK